MNFLFSGNESAVFIGFILQGIGVPLPFPLLFGLLDYLVAKGQVSAFTAVVYAACGSFLGNLVGYYIGYAGSGFLFNKKNRWLRRAAVQVSKMGPGAMLVLRWLGGYAQGAWLLGAARTPLTIFMLYTSMANTLWAAFWVMAGEVLIKKVLY